MSKHTTKRAHGQVRQSQVLTTFGPGAMLDLPNHSVLVGGLDVWSAGGETVVEPRLVEKIRQTLNLPAIELRTPPREEDDPTSPPTGITAWQFPEWFITQDVRLDERRPGVRSRMLIHKRELTNGKFIDEAKKKQAVVPIRFVQACRLGHISDIDWKGFVHKTGAACPRRLWIDERGTSGDLAEVFVRCECGQERSVGEAAWIQAQALGRCNGLRPWLGLNSRESCGEFSRLLIRTASNAYFPQVLNVISLPDRDERIRDAVDQVWEHLSEVEDVEQLRYERKKARVKAALEQLSDDEVFAELQSRRSGQPQSPKRLKLAELETLQACQDEQGVDDSDSKFLARALPRELWDRPWMQPIERVVLVHRLREVMALLGFTRFEPQSPDVNGELDMNVRRAAITRDSPTWLPAVENRGEGIFVQFRRQAVEDWLARDDVRKRGRQLEAGFQRWQADHHGSHRKFFGVPYVLLHSFSHLLITAVSLECGYPASSIRERVYALSDAGYGVLLYTATPDAEGTLGGLIQAGHRIDEHVRNALERGELCSNDPVCAEHDPQNPHEHRYLHGAACHGCLLIAETSCEQQNDFLDRALVVPTVENLGIQFFPWPPP